eukprot:jgi/Mesvir1/16966/Mv15814-RA.1
MSRREKSRERSDTHGSRRTPQRQREELWSELERRTLLIESKDVIDELVHKNEEIEAEIAVIKQAYTDLKVTSKRAYDEKVEQLASLTKQLHASQAEAQVLRQNVATITQKHASLEGVIQLLQADATRRSGDLQQLQAQMARLQADHAQVEAALARKSQQAAALEALCAQQRAELAQVVQERQQLKVQLAAEAARQAQAVSSRLAALEAQLQQRTREAADAAESFTRQLSIERSKGSAALSRAVEAEMDLEQVKRMLRDEMAHKNRELRMLRDEVLRLQETRIHSFTAHSSAAPATPLRHPTPGRASAGLAATTTTNPGSVPRHHPGSATKTTPLFTSPNHGWPNARHHHQQGSTPGGHHHEHQHASLADASRWSTPGPVRLAPQVPGSRVAGTPGLSPTQLQWQPHQQQPPQYQQGAGLDLFEDLRGQALGMTPEFAVVAGAGGLAAAAKPASASVSRPTPMTTLVPATATALVPASRPTRSQAAAAIKPADQGRPSPGPGTLRPGTDGAQLSHGVRVTVPAISATATTSSGVRMNAGGMPASAPGQAGVLDPSGAVVPSERPATPAVTTAIATLAATGGDTAPPEPVSQEGRPSLPGGAPVRDGGQGGERGGSAVAGSRGKTLSGAGADPSEPQGGIGMETSVPRQGSMASVGEGAGMAGQPGTGTSETLPQGLHELKSLQQGVETSKQSGDASAVLPRQARGEEGAAAFPGRGEGALQATEASEGLQRQHGGASQELPRVTSPRSFAAMVARRRKEAAVRGSGVMTVARTGGNGTVGGEGTLVGAGGDGTGARIQGEEEGAADASVGADVALGNGAGSITGRLSAGLDGGREPGMVHAEGFVPGGYAQGPVPGQPGGVEQGSVPPVGGSYGRGSVPDGSYGQGSVPGGGHAQGHAVTAPPALLADDSKRDRVIEEIRRKLEELEEERRQSRSQGVRTLAQAGGVSTRPHAHEHSRTQAQARPEAQEHGVRTRERERHEQGGLAPLRGRSSWTPASTGILEGVDGQAGVRVDALPAMRGYGGWPEDVQLPSGHLVAADASRMQAFDAAAATLDRGSAQGATRGGRAWLDAQGALSHQPGEEAGPDRPEPGGEAPWDGQGRAARGPSARSHSVPHVRVRGDSLTADQRGLDPKRGDPGGFHLSGFDDRGLDESRDDQLGVDQRAFDLQKSWVAPPRPISSIDASFWSPRASEARARVSQKFPSHDGSNGAAPQATGWMFSPYLRHLSRARARGAAEGSSPRGSVRRPGSRRGSAAARLQDTRNRGAVSSDPHDRVADWLSGSFQELLYERLGISADYAGDVRRIGEGVGDAQGGRVGLSGRHTRQMEHMRELIGGRPEDGRRPRTVAAPSSLRRTHPTRAQMGDSFS